VLYKSRIFKNVFCLLSCCSLFYLLKALSFLFCSIDWSSLSDWGECNHDGMSISSSLLSALVFWSQKSSCCWNLCKKGLRNTMAARWQARHGWPIISHDSVSLQLGQNVMCDTESRKTRKEHVKHSDQGPNWTVLLEPGKHLQWKAAILHVFFFSMFIIGWSMMSLDWDSNREIPKVFTKYLAAPKIWSSHLVFLKVGRC